MNNTTTRRNLTIVAIFMAATLVVGTLATTTTLTQTTAFAYSKNKKDNGKGGNDNGNTVTIQKCKQAATQSGFDNNQAQECENVICTHPGENATCVQEGKVAAVTPKRTPTPVKNLCEECFTSLLTPDQISRYLSVSGFSSLAEACETFESGPVDFLTFGIQVQIAGASPTTASELIACLRNAGIMI
jgi:hypothetical protein